MQVGHYSFHCRFARFGVDADRNAATVINDCHAAILMNDHLNGITPALHGLINTIVQNLAKEVMKATAVGTADIHAGPAANSIQAF
jgi:hypothetical protein